MDDQSDSRPFADGPFGLPSFRANDVGPFGHPNPDPGPEYRETFTQDLKDSIVKAVQYTYEIVQEPHDPSLGFDAHTYGYNVYRVGTFQLNACCDRSNGKLERVQELKSLFRIKTEAYTLGFYKVGSSVDTNIWEAFPTSENGAMSVSYEGQPFLLGLEESMLDRVEDARYVVVAHLGNPSQGLCAIYLCIPIQAEGGKIKRWGFVEAIYRRDQGLSAAPPPPTPSGPPPVNPERPVAPQEEPEADVIVTAR
jgi:hypothetical protein